MRSLDICRLASIPTRNRHNRSIVGLIQHCFDFNKQQQDDIIDIGQRRMEDEPGTPALSIRSRGWGKQKGADDPEQRGPVHQSN